MRNASEATEHAGHVVVGLAAVDGGGATLSVEDDGIGIPEAEQIVQHIEMRASEVHENVVVAQAVFYGEQLQNLQVEIQSYRNIP